MPNVQSFFGSGTYQVTGTKVTYFYAAQYSVASVVQPNLTSVGPTNQAGTPFHVTETFNGVSIPIPHARVVAYQQNIAVDMGVTDKTGACMLFLPSGTYDVEIESPSYSKMFRNKAIASGILPCYSYVSGVTSATQVGDVYTYSPTLQEVMGTLVDQRRLPIPNAEIVITSNNTVVVYVLTDANGNYKFTLSPGTYDVHLRGPGKPVKIYHNFTFTGTTGFMSELAQLDVNFNTGGDWLWTSN